MHKIQVGVASRPGPLLVSFKRLGIPVHYLPSQGDVWRRKIHSLYSIVTKGKYSIIHANNSYRLAVYYKKHYRTPLIATVHGAYHVPSDLIALSKQANTIITVSPKLTTMLLKHRIPANQIKMITNGIDTNQFNPIGNKHKSRQILGISQNAQILVYAGRFERDKYPLASKVIRAAASIARTNKNFSAILYGPGPYRNQLAQLANALNRRLGRKAIFVRPSISNIQLAYHSADVIVGTGRVALEAMACAKPVVAAGVAGYCGIIRPKTIQASIRNNFGDHGSIAPLTVNRLVGDIRNLLKHPQWAYSLGKYGAKIIESRFSMTRIGYRILQTYRKTERISK
jgi:glycosyltransferase involved in cell wall biosynthesis